MDPESGISYDEPSPNSFSFNSPYGACPVCNGLGVVEEITEESVIPDKSLSISRGAIAPLGEYRELWIFKEIEAILKKYKLNLTTPVVKFPEELLHALMYGTEEEATVPSKKYVGEDYYSFKFEGIVNFLKRQQENSTDKIQEWLKDFMVVKTCPECEGARLKERVAVL